ncbi:peptidase inhibitor R3HDML [Echinococcus multilocularis]|uniref:Peptidase inhibitor R3HDML n=1 Tax=Echinococcus multilocularis TaxID=6211 RepID=A0A068YA30_ECHMU|nr:peptidase inhibitor R3HDML [Echinococcus multilocularis]
MRSALNLLGKVFSLIGLISATMCYYLTNVERAQILEAHLQVRENVLPTASNMKIMRYSRKLEELAAYWAGWCQFEHPDPNYYHHYRGIGQNIALYFGRKPPLTDSVCGWASEVKHYKYSTNRCSRVCDHYTQIVWANTDELGCAMRECYDVLPGYQNPQYLIVCQYKPIGNYAGQRPYISGEICKGCNSTQSCLRNQCAKHNNSRIYPLEALKNPKYKTLPKCLNITF